MTAGLAVTGLSKRYDGRPVLDAVSLAVPPGGLMAVLGPSGCGKSTLLRGIAGLIAVDGGTVLVAGRRVDDLPLRQRGIVYLGQEPLLFPHLDVSGNLAFGLKLSRRPPAVIAARVRELIGELGLQGLEQRNPGDLSGGERQRVAFGRALAIEPAVLLLDEPFSSLDAITRSSMQQLFRRVARHHAITTVLVTHDLKEALVMGDCFGLMHDGQLTTHADRAAFAAAPASGVARERAFWEALDTGGSCDA
ncbi:ABC transporter ATP-binding protein [Nevskia sp.]|uniref:ABC transporter ATP-binding protein n=1 Tax=Nevskia sp. TaxID=1929292 RepID=UPI0025E1817C|nr:ABC transporter ATP-binding protein [Nevskia sp.]